VLKLSFNLGFAGEITIIQTDFLGKGAKSEFHAECPSALFPAVIPVQFLPRICVPATLRAIKRQTEYGCRPEGRLAYPFDDSPPLPS